MQTMKQYTIEIISNPLSQHPNRYLNVVTDRLEWVMDQYGRNRHAHTWNIVGETTVPSDTRQVCEPIKYKYTRDGDAIVTGSNA